MLDVCFHVEIEPVPKGRPRATIGPNGKPLIYTPKNTAAFETRLALMAAQHRPREVITTRVAVEILTLTQRPLSMMGPAYADDVEWREVRPDIDNYDKAVFDALKGWWTDDALVVSLRAVKLYSSKVRRQGVAVRVRDVGAVRDELSERMQAELAEWSEPAVRAS